MFCSKFPKVPKFQFESWYLNKNMGLSFVKKAKNSILYLDSFFISCVVKQFSTVYFISMTSKLS